MRLFLLLVAFVTGFVFGRVVRPKNQKAQGVRTRVGKSNVDYDAVGDGGRLEK